MPSIRIVSWNSTGESPPKFTQLEGVAPQIATLYPAFPNIDIYLIQEAQNGIGGAIHTGLSVLPGYTVHHIPEQPTGGGRGYICATRNALVTVNIPLALYDYAMDPNWGAINTLPGIDNVLQRPPAYTVLTITGQRVLLITWHAPIGPSLLPIIVGTMPGGGLIDAYVALANCQLITNPAAVAGGPVDRLIVAGDLNTTGAGLQNHYSGFRPLDNFNGLSHHLDHILANGGFVVEGHHEESLSVHHMMSSRVHWT